MQLSLGVSVLVLLVSCTCHIVTINNMPTRCSYHPMTIPSEMSPLLFVFNLLSSSLCVPGVGHMTARSCADSPAHCFRRRRQLLPFWAPPVQITYTRASLETTAMR